MKTFKKIFPKQIPNNQNPTDQSKVTSIGNGIKEKETGTRNEKRKAMWWEKGTVFTAIISILIAIWTVIYAHEGIKVANQALQKSDESNEIAKQAKKVSEKANSLSAIANDIAEKSKVISNESNNLSKIANDIANNSINLAEKSNILSIEANNLSKESNKIATKSATAAEEAVKESREMQKIAIDANNITHMFNKTQYNIQRANLLKEGKELFESEKAVCCRKIINNFAGYFYVMADLSQEKMYQFLDWNFNTMPIEEENHTKFIGISDKDEEYILKSFLVQVNNQCNPKKNGIVDTKEAIEYYLNIIQDYHNMVALYGMSSEINEYSLLPDISDNEYFVNLYLDKDIITMLYDILPKKLTKDWNIRFNILLKDRKKYRISLLEERDNTKKLYYKKIQSVKPGWFTKVPAFNFWKSMIAFSEKNDNRILEK